MPVVYYPPHLPLHDRLVFHSQRSEEMWASPFPYLPFLLLATVLFLAGLWGMSAVHENMLPSSISPQFARLVISLLPPLILMVVIFLAPQFSSPVWPYQAAMLRDPENRELHWNLAVVATAHIYCGAVAQTEWLSQMVGLSTEERYRALGYVRSVRSRLQQIPVLRWSDALATLATIGVVLAISLALFHNSPLEALLNGVILAFVTQLFMLYLFLQRWQHIRRMMELEDIFEELLPSRPPKAEKSEDEVERWHREQLEYWTGKARNPDEMPKAPWE